MEQSEHAAVAPRPMGAQRDDTPAPQGSQRALDVFDPEPCAGRELGELGLIEVTGRWFVAGLCVLG